MVQGVGRVLTLHSKGWASTLRYGWHGGKCGTGSDDPPHSPQ